MTVRTTQRAQSRPAMMAALLVVLALMLAACGGPPAAAPTSAPAADAPTAAPAADAPTAAPAAGGASELVIGLEGDIVAMDPAFSYDFTTGQAAGQVAEGLLKFENGNKLVPNLAESWEASPDGLVYTYKIRQGVTFQDGSPMTLDDVLFSMERTRAVDTASYVGWMYANVETIAAVGNDTVQVTLKQPDALWQYVPATTAGHVISKKFYEANAANFGKPGVGILATGPYAFVSWESGNQIVLKKYDGYWNKANGGPYLDTITLKILPEPTTRVAGLQTGELGMILGQGVPPDQLPIVEKMANVKVTLSDSYLNDFIAFNTQRPPFDNVKLRQALNYAVDKAQVTKTIWGEAALTARAVPLGPRIWVFNEDLWKAAYEKLPTYDKDLAKAKQLLDESGVADQLNGKVINTDENPVRLGQALALQAAAQELGYTLEIQKVTYQELTTLAFGGARDYDIVVTSWGSDFPDPSGNLLPVFHSRNVGDGGSNFGNYKNTEVDKLLDDANASLDNTERTELMTKAQQIIADESVWIVFDHPKQILALNSAFSGYEVNPLWYWDAFCVNIKQN